MPHSLYVRQFIFSVHVFFAAAIHLSVVSANASLFMKVLAERLGHDVPVFSPSWFVAPLAQTAISTFQNTIIYRDGAGRGRDMGRLCIGWRGADATALLLLLEDAGRRGGCAAAVGAAFIAAEEQSQKGESGKGPSGKGGGMMNLGGGTSDSLWPLKIPETIRA